MYAKRDDMWRHRNGHSLFPSDGGENFLHLPKTTRYFTPYPVESTLKSVRESRAEFDGLRNM